MTGSEHEMPSDLRTVLDTDGSFTSTWLRDKSVVPVPAGAQIDSALARRIRAGYRAVGASHVLGTSLTDALGTTYALPGSGEWADIHPPVLLRTPDLQGAALFPESGYALIAGTAAFMAAAVSEGLDTARARFARYARALSERHPSLLTVAAAHQPEYRAWSHLDDIDPTSAAARLVALLHAFTDGTCSAPDFAHGWWKTQRVFQANGERAQGALADLFDRVFMILEDYSVDPDLAEPGDLDDAELQTSVRTAWDTYRHYETDRNR